MKKEDLKVGMKIKPKPIYTGYVRTITAIGERFYLYKFGTMEYAKLIEDLHMFEEVKEKVKMWQYCYKYDGYYTRTSRYFKSDEDFRSNFSSARFTDICKIENSMIEVEKK